MRKLAAIIACTLVAASCASVKSTPYYLYATGLKCDAVRTTGPIALVDPTQTFSVCRDATTNALYFPNGVMANTDVAGVSGVLSAAISQSAQVAAFLGGF